MIILHFHFQFVKIEKLNFLKLKEFFKKKAENLNFCAKYERKLLKINLCKGVHPKILNRTLWLISNRVKSGFARFAGSTIFSKYCLFYMGNRLSRSRWPILTPKYTASLSRTRYSIQQHLL